MTVAIDRNTVNTLARQMATDAGYDPNERVNGAHPRWTEYTTLARSQIKAEIEGGAHQPPEYRNRPLHVFGQHEDATIKQMQHCMEFGQVHGAALMPDGHKGYAQPVGGVVAYKDQISVSGVGYDIGCFTGDTRVLTREGQTPSLDEIEGQEVWIVACGPFSNPVPAKGICHKTRTDAPLMRVTLNNGTSTRCTPDHLFMLRDGTYQRADALEPNQPLMNMKYQEITVLSTESLPEREDVYCLSVPGLNNFALAAGVFVHNCGNLAVELDTSFSDIQGKLGTIMQDIRRQISFGVGRVNNTPVEHPLFDDREAWLKSGMMHFREQAVAQLGTVGSGNHYVDVFVDQNGKVWIGVHFGSRGLGHKTATLYLKKAGGRDGMDVPPTVIDVDSDLGQSYLAGMNLAGQYAYAGREWVVEQVRNIIGGNVVSNVHNHHNYCIAGDQIVPTKLGPKRMADVQVGDEVYAFDPQKGLISTKVKDQWLSGQKPILKIRTSNRSIRVSEDHPIQIINISTLAHPERPWHTRNTGTLEWKKAGKIVAGDIIVCAEDYYNIENEKENKENIEFARFVGAFIGDGWTRSKTICGYTVGLAIGGKDDEHTADYLNLVSRLFPEKPWRNNVKGAFGLTVSNKTLHTLVTKLHGTTSDKKRLPSFAFDLSKKEKLALLAGYMDADGSVANYNTKNHGRSLLCSVNKTLLEDIRELAISCGLRISPIIKNHSVTNFGPCTIYKFGLSVDSTNQLPLWHRGKAANQRKTIYAKNHALQISKIGYVQLPPGTFAQKVQTVEQDGEEAVYDLTVEHQSHSFVCEGIIVHNCWRETHHGEDLWVVRKGATPAFPGQRGFVGGSMGDDAVILEGLDNPDAARAYHSTVHGAGRVFGRMEAKRRFSRTEMDAWLQQRGVMVSGGDIDESPMAYRRLPDVLAYQQTMVRVLHTLRPVIVLMAGDGEFDPYKD